MAGVATDLLPPAAVASLDDSHEVSVVSLLLGLGTSRSRVRHIAAVSRHDLHSRQVREVGGLVPRSSLGRLASRGGSGSVDLAPVPVGHNRASVEGRTVTRVLKRAGSSRRHSGGSHGVDGVELEGLTGQVGVLKEVERD